MLEGSDPIRILDFLPAFQKACNTNWTHEGAATWLFQVFMKRTTGAAINARTCRSGSSCARHELKLKSYCRVIHYFLATYGTNDITAVDDMVIINFKHPAEQSPFECGQTLWTEALHCVPVYNEYSLR